MLDAVGERVLRWEPAPVAREFSDAVTQHPPGAQSAPDAAAQGVLSSHPGSGASDCQAYARRRLLDAQIDAIDGDFGKLSQDVEHIGVVSRVPSVVKLSESRSVCGYERKIPDRLENLSALSDRAAPPIRAPALWNGSVHKVLRRTRDGQRRVLRLRLGSPTLPAPRYRLPAGHRPTGCHAGPGLAQDARSPAVVAFVRAACTIAAAAHEQAEPAMQSAAT